MRGYEEDEYEDWDEYEKDDDEQEEQESDEDGHEETQQQPTQEELEYLSLRQRIKERIRKKRKNELGTANAGSRNDNYGSFFGPSRPIIAQRVIQESKSLLENPDLAERISRVNHSNKKSSVPVSNKSKSQSNNPPRVNGLKKKVEMIKNTRDYSFLLSEDAEVPASKTPPRKSIPVPKSDARSAPPLQRSKQVVNDHRREVFDSRDVRKPVPGSSQSKPRAGLERMAPNSKSQVDSRKQFGSYNGSGPGRPLGPKGIPSRSPGPAAGKTGQPVARNTNTGAYKPNHSSMQPGLRRPMPSNLQSSSHRPAPSNGQTSYLKKSSVPRKEYQETNKPKGITKQALPPPRDQLRRPPPRPPARGSLADERPKAKPKRPIRDEGSDGEDAINMIRKMFGYNPKKFRDDDDDDSNMEANYNDIMREEKRSAKIARQEDEEQQRLIEEEERRERLAKKRKLMRRD